MILSRELGGYGKGIVRLFGSFRVDGLNDPDVIRDGNTHMVESVERDGSGLYTVTLAPRFEIPKRLISARADVATAASPTLAGWAYFVVDSYSQATRSFQVAFYSYDNSQRDDPDDNVIFSWELIGSLSSIGTDSE